ncbi:hypothetical protein TRIP_B350466 [uncultured Desulfatiglans sp.]|uniref:Uncharacterized protein n=1 Tax=Uncultured Desulfatiglans sp. TaxID=1748965 RepID=A0A653ABY6_UNCDX|nr:hypothetical protein TRIP_B350466 [uncultured Desulfatiglans sp.]
MNVVHHPIASDAKSIHVVQLMRLKAFRPDAQGPVIFLERFSRQICCRLPDVSTSRIASAGHHALSVRFH